MKVDFSGVKIKDLALRKTLSQLESKITGLSSTIKSKTDSPEAFLFAPSDTRALEEIRIFSSQIKDPDLKTIFVLGIGGANLAAKAVYEAMRGFGAGRRGLQYIFLDTIYAYRNSDFVEIAKGYEKESEFLIFVVSKSGTTTETLSNTKLLLKFLERKFSNLEDRIVVITEEGSQLWNKLQGSKSRCFPISKKIPDRFSAFTATALLPLSVSRFDRDSFVAGAKDMRALCLQANEENPAIKSAMALNEAISNGIDIYDHFMFLPELESLGKWSRQLTAESLGKSVSKSGKVLRFGFTPTVSMGTADLHSMLELYLSGSKKRFTQFAFADIREAATEDSISFGKADDDFSGKSQGEIILAIYRSVKASYDLHRMPYTAVVFDDINEYELGQYMMFKMLETVFLGHLWDIDIFEQRAVEEYKKMTREILESGK